MFNHLRSKHGFPLHFCLCSCRYFFFFNNNWCALFCCRPASPPEPGGGAQRQVLLQRGHPGRRRGGLHAVQRLPAHQGGLRAQPGRGAPVRVGLGERRHLHHEAHRGDALRAVRRAAAVRGRRRHTGGRWRTAAVQEGGGGGRPGRAVHATMMRCSHEAGGGEPEPPVPGAVGTASTAAGACQQLPSPPEGDGVCCPLASKELDCCIH
mmetsp:Transcript_26116/g.43398  ORF Transcript_26116/g.43398 Transcript_26116/m.43398 type:complete len:208 (-) Transcript_26116:192-815(-)